MKFALIEKAGLSQNEFAALVGVSRITVNTWVTGKHKPTAHVRPRVEHALRHIADMLRNKQLPVDRGHYRRTKLEKLKHIRAVVEANTRTLTAQG